jgi:hypothetical protein
MPLTDSTAKTKPSKLCIIWSDSQLPVDMQASIVVFLEANEALYPATEALLQLPRKPTPQPVCGIRLTARLTFDVITQSPGDSANVTNLR